VRGFCAKPGRRNTMISGYPDKADILVVGRVLDMPDGAPMITGWTMDGRRTLSWVTIDMLGGWSVDELRAIAAWGAEPQEDA
jgi:hypothetical protein